MLTPRTNLDRTLSTFDALTRQMDSLQHLYFGERPRRRRPEARAVVAPTDVTLTEKDGAFIIAADLPGLVDKDVELTVTRDELTIKATRKVAPPEGYRIHRHERSDFALARSYALPAPIDADGVNARMKNGVLTITLPKAPEAKPRTIEIITD